MLQLAKPSPSPPIGPSRAVVVTVSLYGILIGVHLFHLQHMVQAGVGAFPTAPGFPAGGAQTAGAAPGSAAANTVAAANSTDGTGLSSMVVKNAAAVAAAAAAAAQAAQDSQLQHQLKQEANNGTGLPTLSQAPVGVTQVSYRVFSSSRMDTDLLSFVCSPSSVRLCWAHSRRQQLQRHSHLRQHFL